MGHNDRLGHSDRSRPRHGALLLTICATLALAALAFAAPAPASAAVPSRPFQEVFGSVAKPRLTAVEALAFDRAGSNLLAVDREAANEEQQLTIEADANLGGTYALEFEGQKTGWEGEAELHGGEAGTGDIVATKGSGNASLPFAVHGDINKGSTAVTNFSSLVGSPQAGKPIEGQGIPAGTTIVSCSPSCSSGATELTLSAAATQTIAGFFNAYLFTPTKTITELATESGTFQAGYAIEGEGIPAGTTIVSCSPSCGAGATSLTLSENIGGRASETLHAGSLQVTNVSGGPFAEGNAIVGEGIQLGTTIASCSPSCASPSSLTISKPPTATATGVALTAGSLKATAMHTTSGALVVGEQLSGTGVLPGTLVTAVDEGAGTITLDRPPASSGVASDLAADLLAQSTTLLGRDIKEALEALPSVGAGNFNFDNPTERTATRVVRPLSFTGALAQLPMPLISCDGSGLTGTNPTCAVQELHAGHPIQLDRFHQDGTPSPFAALGSPAIDGKSGPGGLPCAQEPASCDATPQGGLERSYQSQVAIDESPFATAGDIYITQEAARLVDVFGADGGYLGQITASGKGVLRNPCGAAVDSSGALYIADERGIHKYSAAAGPPYQATPVADFTTVSKPCSLAAGAGPTAGHLFAVKLLGGGVFELDTDTGEVVCTPVTPDPTGNNNAYSATVDPADGRLFVSSSVDRGVNEYDASDCSGSTPLEPLSRAPLPPGAPEPSTGIAVNPASGELYVGQVYQGGKIETYSAIAKPIVATAAPSGLGGGGATLNGTVNPNGFGLEGCSFEWGLAGAAYEHIEACAESAGEIGAGKAPVPVHLQLSGLSPGAAYHYRLTATNSVGAVEGDERSFFAAGPPALRAETIARVSDTEALLEAEIQPRGFPTRYRVEYGPTAAYGQFSATRSLGSADGSFHQVAVRLTGLAPHTTYHWRFLADNTDEAIPGTGASAGEDRTLATFGRPAPEGGCANEPSRIGPAAYLPDCRAYELVSPLDKNNGDIVPPLQPGGFGAKEGIEQSAVSGDRIAYSSRTAFAGAEGAPISSQYIAQRLSGREWTTHAVNPPRGRLIAENGSGALTAEYEAFSPDLCTGWLRTLAEPVLAEGGVAGFPNIYQRHDGLCGGSGYEAVTRSEPTTARAGEYYELQPQGFSADASRTVYLAPDSLAVDEGPQPPPQPAACSSEVVNCSYRLYEYDSASAKTRYVCILPGGEPVSANCSAGSLGLHPRHDSSLQNAVSADGRRVFWSVPPGGGNGGYGAAPIYVRIDAARTVAVSQAAEALSGTTGSWFWGAARDGSRALFTTTKPGTEISDLYSFDVDQEATKKIAGKVIGVAGMSEDAKRVYFASREAIGGSGPNGEGAEAQAGQPNLYFFDPQSSSYRFIATLAEADTVADGAGTSSPVSPTSIRHSARVIPDGSVLAFSSFASLTGYDNTDAVSGNADTEAFIYEAAADGGAGRLLCASCNPTGSRPAGQDANPDPEEFWVAARVPVWQNSLYATRALSEDGSRLLFDSNDALSLRDANGRQDVYEWEAPGKGSCTAESSSYSPANDGCLYLISSGQAAGDSELRDTDPSGNNVFFATSQSLLPQDYGLIDLYDARVDGGLPLPAAPAPACEGEACQSPPAAPATSTPGSTAFHGPGNLEATAHGGPSRCAKPARRAQKLSGRAGKLRRNAKKVARRNPRKAAAMRRKSARYAKQAKRQSRQARHCRARARKQRRKR